MSHVIILPHTDFYTIPEGDKFGHVYSLLVDTMQSLAAGDPDSAPATCLGKKLRMPLALITARYGGMRARMAADSLDGARGSGRRLSFAVGVGIIGPSFEILIIDAVNERESTLIAEAILKAMATAAFALSKFAQILADAGVTNIARKFALTLFPVPTKIVIRRAPLAPI